ncbi:unnamed protein product [Amaranthus hypochondriacus]
MNEQFSYCGLMGKPHIESKIRISKRRIGYILEIHKQVSGFGWDDATKMGKDGLAVLFCKPFPLYEKLCEIYAKDCAGGSMVKGPGDDEEGDKNEAENDDDAISSTRAIAQSSGRGDRKRRREIKNEKLSGLATALTSLIDVENESTSIMMDMKKLFLQAVEISEKRTNLFEILSNLQELTPIEFVEATTIIGLDNKKVEMFYSVPDKSKVMFVKS